jgi:putative hemolysin
MDPVTLYAIIALLALIGASAFFSSSETAIMSSGRVRLTHAAEGGRPGAQLALALIDRPGSVLATILVGNNLVNVAAAAVATVLWGPFWATLVVTLLLLVFAEVTPKTLAASSPEPWAMRVAAPIRLFEVVLKPVSWVVIAVTNLLLVPLLGRREKLRRNLNRQELLTALRIGAREGELEPSETRMTREILALKDTPVGELVVPLESVTTIPESASFDEVLDIVLRDSHTRYPVTRRPEPDEPDSEVLVGVLLVKELLDDIRNEDYRWQSDVRELHRVPASLEADEVMRDMQIQRFHMALVVDDEGNSIGIVTLEDILEEVVGEIEDELDETEDMIQEVSPGRFLVRGEVEVDDLCKVINVDLGRYDQHVSLAEFFSRRVRSRASRTPRLKIGSTRIIHRADGWFEVRVMSLLPSHRQAPAQSSEGRTA